MPNIPFRYASELYDDIWIPDETIQVRETVRAFAEQYVRPVAHQLNNTPESLEAFPRELVKGMADAGLFRIPFAAEYGGAGLQYPTLATMVMLEGQGKWVGRCPRELRQSITSLESLVQRQSSRIPR